MPGRSTPGMAQRSGHGRHRSRHVGQAGGMEPRSSRPVTSVGPVPPGHATRRMRRSGASLRWCQPTFCAACYVWLAEPAGHTTPPVIERAGGIGAHERGVRLTRPSEFSSGSPKRPRTKAISGRSPAIIVRGHSRVHLLDPRGLRLFRCSLCIRCRHDYHSCVRTADRPGDPERVR